MSQNNLIKELVRFSVSFVLIILLTNYFFSNVLLNEENFSKFITSFQLDLSRFLTLNVTNNTTFLIFVLIYSFLIVAFVTSSNWYHNPDLHYETYTEIYLKLFFYSTLITISVLYFLRIFNVSRLMLILFILIIPLPLQLLRSGGFISRQLIKDNLIYDYILVTEKNNKGYGSVLYTEKIINNKKEIFELFLEKNEIDIFQHFLNIQKKYSFDSILLDVNYISNKIK